MKRRGFTLVELLVVLAMIIILVSAMTASVNSARRRAREAKAQHEMNEITNAVLYAAALTGGKMLDPWGKAYVFVIEMTASIKSGDGNAGSGVSYKTAPQLPNFFRLTPEERAVPERK